LSQRNHILYFFLCSDKKIGVILEVIFKDLESLVFADFLRRLDVEVDIRVSIIFFKEIVGIFVDKLVGLCLLVKMARSEEHTP